MANLANFSNLKYYGWILKDIFSKMSDPDWFWKTSLTNKILFALFCTTGYYAFKLHFEFDLAHKTKLLKKELLQICAMNEDCQETVNSSFQKCFDRNFDENQVGHYQRFNEEGFTECMNKYTNADLFQPLRLDELKK